MVLKRVVPAPVRPHLRKAYNRFARGAAKRQTLRSASPEEQLHLKGTSTVISANDSMSDGDWGHYFAVGLDATRWIDAALASSCSSVETPTTILDMPCGWGRVMRFLAVRFPDADLTGCDIVEDAVGFCAREFGARPVRSSPDLDSLEFPTSFDLIWCGSLVTHLDASSVEALLRLFRRSLSPGGLAVVTTHGSFVEGRLVANDAFYGLEPDAIATILRGYQLDGFGYADYPAASTWEPDTAGYHEASYGISLISRRRMGTVAARADLEETYFAEQAWDGHHDVYGFSPIP